MRGAPVAKNDKQKSRWTKLLLKDGVHKIIAQARAQASGKPCQAAVEKELHYLDHNAGRMLYGTYRKEGLFIGSGVIEAGCKTVIGARCKQSGMFWSRLGRWEHPDPALPQIRQHLGNLLENPRQHPLCPQRFSPLAA